MSLQPELRTVCYNDLPLRFIPDDRNLFLVLPYDLLIHKHQPHAPTIKGHALTAFDGTYILPPPRRIQNERLPSRLTPDREHAMTPKAGGA